MVTKVETLDVGPELELALAGSPLPVTDVRAAVVLAEDGRLLEVRLLAELDPFNWTRLEQAGVHETPPGPFDGALPLRIEARLRETARASLGDAADPYDVVARLRAAEPDSPLRQAESWALLAVTQEMGPGLRGGFATRPPR